MKRLAREKLVEKNIKWGEVYTEKTSFLKEQFEAVVGKGSYFRFEGEDLTHGDRYYCILGPARVHKPRAKFFAGVRKLPATFSAGGKYFDSMDAAARYARETWGVPTPKELKPYTSSSLYGISSKVTKWKEQREREESREEKEEEKEEKKESAVRGDTKMAKFNLAQKLQREAMGYQRQENRPTYQWWDYDEIASGSNEQWNMWSTEIDRSLQTVLKEAQHSRGKIIRDIQYKYSMTPSQIQQMLKTYIGYAPAYGAYICSVGPYMGSEEAGQHKFGYFVKRLRKSSPEAIMESVRNSIKKYKEAYGIELDAGDFKLMVNRPASSFDPAKERQPREIIETVSTLDPNSSEARSFYGRSPMLGIGSPVLPNAKGMTKLTQFLGEQGDWTELYNASVREMATSENISEEDAADRLLNDEDFVKRVYRIVKSKYDAMVESGEAAARGMSPPPPALVLKSKSGQQRFSALTTSKLQKRQLMLKQEILQQLTNGVQDPSQIQSNLNEDIGRKRRGTINIEEVTNILEDINESSIERDQQGNVVRQKNPAELYAEVTNQIEGLLGGQGFNDFETAVETAALYFTGLDVDPASRAKKGLRGAQMAFELDSPVNFDENYLRNFARGEEGQDIEGATQEEIGREIGEIGEVEREIEMPPEEILATPEEAVTEDLIIPPEEPTNYSDLLANTLRSLIKVAKELDQDGKGHAAEEIHQVIRKYQGRLL